MDNNQEAIDVEQPVKEIVQEIVQDIVQEVGVLEEPYPSGNSQVMFLHYMPSTHDNFLGANPPPVPVTCMVTPFLFSKHNFLPFSAATTSKQIFNLS